MVAFILAHQAVLAALAVAIIDLVMALVPSVQANGLLHAVLLQLQSIASPPAPPAS